MKSSMSWLTAWADQRAALRGSGDWAYERAKAVRRRVNKLMTPRVVRHGIPGRIGVVRRAGLVCGGVRKGLWGAWVRDPLGLLDAVAHYGPYFQEWEKHSNAAITYR